MSHLHLIDFDAHDSDASSPGTRNVSDGPASISSALERPSSPSDRERLELLEAFLNVYWLRPENAFWMTLRSLALRGADLAPPAMDMSCGDGLFSFLHAGGRVAPTFDVFASVGRLDRVTHDHADMFDHVDPAYRPPVTRKPDRGLDVGTDLKPAMLAKAKTLEFYGELIQHDNETAPPFEDETFQTLYCNSAYWVRTIEPFLQELRRVIRPDGRVILHVKLDAMRNYTLESLRPWLGDCFLEIIGRGRMACWPSLASRSTWEARFKRAGLTITDARAFVGEMHSRLWDVGLRPIAPLLVRMANQLTPQSRQAIKRDWVALFLELLDPLCRFDFNPTNEPGAPAEVQYILQRA